MKATLSPRHPRQFVKTLASFYDEAWTDWDPEVFILTLSREFGMDFEGEEGALDAEQALALRHLVSSDTPFASPMAFENVAHALSRTHFVHGTLEPCSPGEIVYALWVIDRVYAETPEIPWSVRAYGAACLLESGVHVAPKGLGLDVFKEPLLRASTASPATGITAGLLFDKAWKIRDKGMSAMQRRLRKDIDALRTAPGEGSENLSESDATAARSAVGLLIACDHLVKREVSLADL